MTPAPEWFQEWFDSIYYHKLYFERNEQEAAAFISRLLAVLKPPPGAKMLDVACGRGRHSRILADQGFEVTGIDLAPSSIAYARQFRNDHLDFYVHDMRQLLCTSCFEYVFNFFTSFGYFRTRRENENSIRMISLAMKKDGVFVLDYLNSRYTKDHLVPHSEILIDCIKYDLTRWFDEKHFYKKITIQDPQLAAPLTFTEKIARFSPDDFAAMLSRGGLAIRQLYGSYALEPFDIIQSPRLIIIATKAPQKKVAP